MTQNWNAVHFQPDDNPTLNALARTHSMQDVWYKLPQLFPMIRAHNLGIWEARRNGAIGGLIQSDDRFTSIRDPMGPQNKEQWVLLAQAVIEAMYGVIPTEEELQEYKYLGTYDPYRRHNERVKNQFK